MKKIILSESELVSLIKSIMEQDTKFDFSDIDDLDYYDALFFMFRNWVQQNLSDSEKDAPVSYLLDKFGKRFVLELMGDGEFPVDDNFEINRWNIPRVVQGMVKKGKYKFPTKRKQEKFTEKFKKHIDYFINELNLPSWAKINLIENVPYKVDFELELDFPEMIKSEGDESISPYNLERKFKNYVEGYLGVEFGNPNYGHLDLDKKNTKFSGLESWVKNVLNKEIKAKIRALPYGRNVHSMKFEPREGRSDLKIIFKSSAGWNGKHEFKKEVLKLLNDMGYKKIGIDY